MKTIKEKCECCEELFTPVNQYQKWCIECQTIELDEYFGRYDMPVSDTWDLPVVDVFEPKQPVEHDTDDLPF